MYIFVRKSDNIVVGYANRPVNEADMNAKGNLVYEIDNEDFNDSIIGSKLESFDLYEN